MIFGGLLFRRIFSNGPRLKRHVSLYVDYEDGFQIVYFRLMESITSQHGPTTQGCTTLNQCCPFKSEHCLENRIYSTTVLYSYCRSRYISAITVKRMFIQSWAHDTAVPRQGDGFCRPHFLFYLLHYVYVPTGYFIETPRPKCFEILLVPCSSFTFSHCCYRKGKQNCRVSSSVCLIVVKKSHKN